MIVSMNQISNRKNCIRLLCISLLVFILVSMTSLTGCSILSGRDAGDNSDYVVLEEGLSDEVYAIGFRKKDQALRDAVNSTLAAMKADGKFDEISAKWFGK